MIGCAGQRRAESFPLSTAYAKSAAMHFLDFEKPIAALETKIEELRHLSDSDGINIAEEINRLQIRLDRLLTSTYGKLTPWQKAQVARHPDRPHASDYINALIT